MSETKLNATLTCGVNVDVFQSAPHDVIQVTVTPKEGSKIEDSLQIKDNVARLVFAPEVLLGLNTIVSLLLGTHRQIRKVARRALMVGIFVGTLIGLGIASFIAWIF